MSIQIIDKIKKNGSITTKAGSLQEWESCISKIPLIERPPETMEKLLFKLFRANQDFIIGTRTLPPSSIMRERMEGCIMFIEDSYPKHDFKKLKIIINLLGLSEQDLYRNRVNNDINLIYPNGETSSYNLSLARDRFARKREERFLESDPDTQRAEGNFRKRILKAKINKNPEGTGGPGSL